MTDVILHHFDISPFAEKIRLVFGLKNLSWSSVQIPLIMPKPDLTALTGGYRKTPVMQIGADIYCDTQCIALELERRFPEPTLFPGSSKALSLALSSWSDIAFFQPGAGLSMGTNEGLPEDLLSDRMQFFEFMDFAQLPDQLPHLYAQFGAHIQRVEQMLSDGRRFVLGELPGWADILAYFPIWMSHGNIPNSAELFVGLDALALWQARLEGMGHGPRCELSVAEAHRQAANAEPEESCGVDSSCYPKLAAGQQVRIAPSDYGKDPVVGELLSLNHESVSVLRETNRFGNLAVHFPRTGYSVEAVE